MTLICTCRFMTPSKRHFLHPCTPSQKEWWTVTSWGQDWCFVVSTSSSDISYMSDEFTTWHHCSLRVILAMSHMCDVKTSFIFSWIKNVKLISCKMTSTTLCQRRHLIDTIRGAQTWKESLHTISEWWVGLQIRQQSFIRLNRPVGSGRTTQTKSIAFLLMNKYKVAAVSRSGEAASLLQI
jgi:hypothetical protein